MNIRDYSQAKVNTWAPDEWGVEQWKIRLAKTNPFISEIDGQLVGFAGLEENGHIDSFYCDHQWQVKGIGSSLLQIIGIEAKGQVITLREKKFKNFTVSKCIRDNKGLHRIDKLLYVKIRNRYHVRNYI